MSSDEQDLRRSAALGAALRTNRRTFLGGGAAGLGALALGSLSPALGGAQAPGARAKAKRVISLFQSGAPSQFETLDPKPGLLDQFGQELPESVRKGQRLTTMTSGQSSFPIAPSKFGATRRGESGALMGDLLTHTGAIADKLCIVRSMVTEAINHDPAMTFAQTGSQLAGRPSMGAWLSYGLGSMNEDLPTFVVMVSSSATKQPLYARLWGSGFLPTRHQGVKLRSGEDPVLYLANAPGIDRARRRAMLDDLERLNGLREDEDPERDTRVEQYELAFRMQAAVPDLTDISDEPEAVLERYGPDVRRPGTFARNCLLARRMAERDVRFVQLFHMGWDHHGNLPKDLTKCVKDTDQPSAALVQDLEERGLLDDTIVVWGGEFGRTVYSQGELTEENYGRDHHPRCFPIWLAGGGFAPGVTHGETCDHSYNVVRDPVSTHDLHATLLHQLGLDHERLTYRFQGRDFRLTDVHGELVKGILS
ncbi:MAG: DUF1501 domain-containing protein [Planctomycetota bacterium]|nr:DUF1501 domain-containing protein [Planctomycetota bacterium]